MDDFLDIIGRDYDAIKSQFRKCMKSNGMTFDEDIFGETMVKCQERFGDKRMDKDEAIGYFWASFKTNTIREKRYCRNINKCELQDNDAATFDDGGILLKNTLNKIGKIYGERDLNNFLRHAEGETYDSIGSEFNKKRYSEIKDYIKSVV